MRYFVIDLQTNKVLVKAVSYMYALMESNKYEKATGNVTVIEYKSKYAY